MRALKRFIKTCLWLIALVVCLPLIIWVRLWSLRGGDSAFQFASQFMSLYPGVSGVLLRQAFYFMVLDAPWPGPRISFGTLLAQRDTSFGRGVFIGATCNLGRCHIGDRTLIGSGVHVASARAHEFEDAGKAIDDQGGEIRKVLIGADCWVGNAAVILADIADGVVVGAGSVVVKPCEKYGVYVGNPARLIKERSIVLPGT
jgi:hypothetical protein